MRHGPGYLADVLANRAANMGELDLNVAGGVIFYTHLCKRIQLRLATIVCNLPHRNATHKAKLASVPKLSFEVALAQSQHAVDLDNRVIRCRRCKAVTSTASSTRWSFVYSDCHAARQYCNRPSVIPNPIMIGRRTTHASHRLKYYKGITYCSYCGFMANKVMRGLFAVCKGAGSTTQHGDRVLSAIEADTCPIVGEDWPKP